MLISLYTIHIIHRNDPEDKLGPAGQFIYDWNCISDCRKHHFDIMSGIRDLFFDEFFEEFEERFNID